MCEWMSGNGIDVQIEPLEEWKNLPVDPITATGGPSKEWETFGTSLLQEFAEQSARSAVGFILRVLLGQGNDVDHNLALPHPAPPSRPLNMSDPPFRYTITVPEAETAAIVTATKKLGVSVSVLFHAAHCLAQIKMNPIPGTATKVDFSSDMTV